MELKGYDGKALRLPKSFYQRPLTAQEAQFAGQHCGLVWRYLAYRGLDEAEWFDAVVFRYLLTVKRWFALPQLRQVKFSTLAWQAMRSAVGNELQRQSRTPPTVSLYGPIPGSEDLLLIDVIPAPGTEFCWEEGEDEDLL